MKGLDWGLFYNRFKNNTYSTTALEDNIKRLMMDDDVTSKKVFTNTYFPETSVNLISALSLII
jgi:hypothetical protein